MLPRSRRHVANHVAKRGPDVANYVAKSMFQTVGWQHRVPVLNTERAFAAVFRLSLSEFGMNL
jgi:phosphoribulokinase